MLEDFKKVDRDTLTGDILYIMMRWKFQKDLRMTNNGFEFLLCIVGHKFVKQDIIYKKDIPVIPG